MISEKDKLALITRITDDVTNGMSNILRDVYGFTHSVMVDTQNAAGLYTINALVHEPMANKGRYMNLLYRAISWGDTGGYE